MSKKTTDTSYTTFSKFIETVGESSVKSIFELAWSLVSAYGKKAIDKTKVSIALKNYKENYFRRHGEVKVLAMTKPLPLNDIYTKVRFVSGNRKSINIDMQLYQDRFRQ